MSFRTLVTGPACRDARAGWALFALRVSVGSMMLLGHGWRKLMAYGDLTTGFSDPLGIGSAASATLAVFAEVFCSAALVLGLATRWVAIPLMTTMAVAAFIVHGDDPFAKKELALLYFASFLALFVAGPGRLALDNLIRRGDRR